MKLKGGKLVRFYIGDKQRVGLLFKDKKYTGGYKIEYGDKYVKTVISVNETKDIVRL